MSTNISLLKEKDNLQKITWQARNFIDSTILLANELAEACSSCF